LTYIFYYDDNKEDENYKTMSKIFGIAILES